MARSLRVSVLITIPFVCLLTIRPLSGRQAAAPSTLTLSVKGSTAYAQPTPAPVQAALMVVTPVWEDVEAKTEVGSKEASGQLLFVGDLAVVLSSRALDCTTVFKTTPPDADQDFLIVAGKAEAYLPAKGWQTTVVGKVFTDASESAQNHLPIDRFSVQIQGGGLKKKTVAKDNLRGNDGRLILDQAAGQWRVDFAAKADDVVAEGKMALTPCPIASRKKAVAAPLLGERRLLDAARNF